MGRRSSNVSQYSMVSIGYLLSLLLHPMPAHLQRSAAAVGESIMWALTALLLLVPSNGQAATLEKPILSLHPPWTTIFKGERVTLRCDGYHPLLLELRPISTLWYLGHLLLPSHKKSIEVQTPGVYRCQTRGAPVSDPIHLSVSNAPTRPTPRPRPQTVGERLQLRGTRRVAFTGSALELASTTAPVPQAAALAPGNSRYKPLSFRKPPVSRSVPSVTSVPNTTSAGLQFPTGRAPTAGPPACAPRTPLEQSAGALKPDVDLLLREMQLLKGLLSRMVLELKEPQAFPEHRETMETLILRVPVSPGAPETATVES
nr:PREDICTED: LOW QUALITY PROTEIN: Fc receptor-like B [Equus przewalskii]